MLNEMRLGMISDKTVRNFQSLSRPLRFNDGLEVTELLVHPFPTVKKKSLIGLFQVSHKIRGRQLESEASQGSDWQVVPV
jgi:hypothetical protein